MMTLLSKIIVFAVPNWLRDWPAETADFSPSKRKR